MPQKQNISKAIEGKETPEERIARYRQNKKNKEQEEREKRREEKLANKASDRRLVFLVNVFQTLGYTTKKVGEIAGISQQLLSWYFSVKDDCRLSVAQHLMDSIGYNLGVKFKKEDTEIVTIDLGNKKEGNNNGVRFTIEGDIQKDLKWKNPYIPAFIQECNKSKRMNFLANYFTSLKLGVLEFCQACGMDPTSLRYIFMKDDCRISQIFDIAKGTGGEIIWEINRKH